MATRRCFSSDAGRVSNTWGPVEILQLKKHRGETSFEAACARVLRQVHPRFFVTRQALAIICEILVEALVKIAKTATTSLKYSTPHPVRGQIVKHRRTTREEVLVSPNEDEWWWVPCDVLEEAGSEELPTFLAASGPDREEIFRRWRAAQDWYDEFGELGAREIQTALRVIMGSNELCKHAVSEGTKSFVKWTNPPSDPRPGQTEGQLADAALRHRVPSLRAGLDFPISQVAHELTCITNVRVTEGAACYTAAVLGYLAAELLELAGNLVRDDPDTLQPCHVFRAVQQDEELSALIGPHATFLGSGVIPQPFEIAGVCEPSAPWRWVGELHTDNEAMLIDQDEFQTPCEFSRESHRCYRETVPDSVLLRLVARAGVAIVEQGALDAIASALIQRLDSLLGVAMSLMEYSRRTQLTPDDVLRTLIDAGTPVFGSGRLVTSVAASSEPGPDPAAFWVRDQCEALDQEHVIPEQQDCLAELMRDDVDCRVKSERLELPAPALAAHPPFSCILENSENVVRYEQRQSRGPAFPFGSFAGLVVFRGARLKSDVTWPPASLRLLNAAVEEYAIALVRDTATLSRDIGGSGTGGATVQSCAPAESQAPKELEPDHSIHHCLRVSLALTNADDRAQF